MDPEEKEESKQLPEGEAPDAPTEETSEVQEEIQEPLESLEKTDPMGEPAGQPVSEPVEPDRVVLSKEEYDVLKKDANLTETYRTDLIALKGKKRSEELFDEESEVENQSPVATDWLLNDYLSKRADVRDEFRGQIQKLSDEEYATIRQQLQIGEGVLRKQIGRKAEPASRQQIKDLFQGAIDFARFKHRPLEKTDEPVPQIEDMGSTRSIRRPVTGKSRISPEAYQIAKASRVKGDKDLTPEQVQKMIDAGQIKV